MALEQKLSLKLSQRLVMTPSLQQAIKLLQMTRMELENVVAQELEANPVLEEIEDAAEEEEAIAASGMPISVTVFTPRRGTSCWAAVAPTMIPTVTGRNASPVVMAE